MEEVEPVPPFMVTPPCLELKESLVDAKQQGVFCKEQISIGSKFGPFVGDIIPSEELQKREKDIDFRYAWHVSDSKTNKELHVVNATEPEKGNWMRFVNSARYYEEQNIMSVQEGNEIYYKALKDINPGEELLTWFTMNVPKGKGQKRKRESQSLSALPAEPKEIPSDAAAVGNGKRLRKRKIAPDMLSSDDNAVRHASSGLHHNRIKNNSSNQRRRRPSKAANKVMGNQTGDCLKNQTPGTVIKSPPVSLFGSKLLTSTSQQTVSTSQQTAPLESSELYKTLSAAPFPQPASNTPVKRGKKNKSIISVVDFLNSKHLSNGDHHTMENLTNSEAKPVLMNSQLTNRPKQKRSNLVGTAEYMEEHLATDFQFLFSVTPGHRVVSQGSSDRVRYACEICDGRYRKALNLKRHLLREHVNHKYLSPEDVALLDHTTAMSTARIEADADPDADDIDVPDSPSENNLQVKQEGTEEDVESLQLKEEMIEIAENAQVDGPAAMNSSVLGSTETDRHVTDSTPAETRPEPDRQVLENSLTSKAMEGKATFSYDGVASVDDAFRCHLCVQLFPSVEKLKYHLTNDAHRSKGDKQFGCDRCSQRFRFRHNYQRHMESHGAQLGKLSTPCLICSKRFRNEANMRKHLRFHSGRNFPCKHGCNLVYHNVARLVKHLRNCHPELPTRSQLGIIAVLNKSAGRPLKGKEATPSCSQTQPGQYRTEEEAIQEFQASHPAGWTETRGRKPQKGLVGHQCPICKKKFSTHGSMCRHRRSVHNVSMRPGKLGMVALAPSSPPALGEEDAAAWDDGTVNIEASVERLYDHIEREQAAREAQDDDFDFSPPPSPRSYYENVSENVSNNLLHYVDGGYDSLKTANQHIRWDDENKAQNAQPNDFDWTQYNFPPFFSPVNHVVPNPPVPPAASANVTSSVLCVESDSSLAYPTRLAVAEREATRRRSVGAPDNSAVDISVVGEREKIPRRASMGSLDRHAREEGFRRTRRASVGSFENQEPTDTNTDTVNTDIISSAGMEETLKGSSAEGENAESKIMEQSDRDSENVSIRVGTLEQVCVPENDGTSSPEPVTVSGMESMETEAKEEKTERSVLSSELKEKTPSEEQGNEGSATSVSDQNISKSMEENCEMEKLQSCNSLITTAEQSVDFNKDSTTVSPVESTGEYGIAATCSSAFEEEAVADDKEDASEGKKPHTSVGHPTDAVSFSNGQEEASVVQDRVGKSTETAGMERSDGASLSAVTEEVCLQLVQKNSGNVVSKSAVSENHAESDRQVTNMGVEISEDTGSKSEHAPPTMISKSADGTHMNGAEGKPSNDLSEKDLNYLSEGCRLYVQRNKKHCDHPHDTATIPARLIESQEEEDYLSKLCLSVKRVKPPLSASDSRDISGDKAVNNRETAVSASGPNTDTEDSLVPEEAHAPTDQMEVFPGTKDGHVSNEVVQVSREEADKQTSADRTVASEKCQEMSGKEVQLAHSSTQALAQPVLREGGNSPASCDLQPSEPVGEEEDSDEDDELMKIRAQLELQILQERVAIDREAEEICQRCQPENTEFGEPSNRTAEDFAKMQFGRKRAIYVVCSMCKRYFHDVESVLKHQVKKHPLIQCSYFEVENGLSLETVFYPQISSRGILAESVPLPPEYASQESYTCTRCKLAFKTYSRLRGHILNCDPNTPTTPHTRKKKTKSNRHRFMEKMLPDSDPKGQEGKAAENSSAIRNLNFRSKSRGTVVGLRASTFRSPSKNYKHFHQNGLKKKEEASSSAGPAPSSRLPSTRVKTQNRKYSSPQSGPTSSGKVGRPQRRRNHEMRYNPAAHARRRDKVECVDIHQCQGCRLSFRTLFLLEHHTKNCASKDKILGQIPAANKLPEGNQTKNHSCRYCPKRFSFLKGVYNHYNNFCRVRAERVAGGGLTAEDVAHEQQLEASLQQQAWNKTENRDHTDVIQGRALLLDDGTIRHTRRKGGWPRGLKRSNKRRRNGWTYIKRHKPDGNSSEATVSPSKVTSSPGKVKSVGALASTAPAPAPAPAPGSAVSAAMSELEARLREPVAQEVKKEPSAEELELPSESQSGVAKLKLADTAVIRGEPQKLSPKEKVVNVEDDLSQAPVIDRMDTAPPALPRDTKQKSPDLEPPILSPITPVTAKESVETKRKRKPKQKAVDLVPQKKENQTAEKSSPKLVMTQAVLGSVNRGPQGEATGITPAFAAAPMQMGDAVSGPLFVLGQVTDASGNQPDQLKDLPLKIPNILSHLSFITLGTQQTADQIGSSIPQSTNCGNTGSEQKSLPPNFLFPASSELTEQKKDVGGEKQNKQSTNSTAVGAQEGSVDSGTSTSNTEETKAQRKPRQRKKKSEDAPATTIKELFKKRKSPIRSRPKLASNTDADNVAEDLTTAGSLSFTSPDSCSTAAVKTLLSMPSSQVSSLLLSSGTIVAVPLCLSTSLASTSASPISLSPRSAGAENKLRLVNPSGLTSILSSLSPPAADHDKMAGDNQPAAAAAAKVSLTSVQWPSVTDSSRAMGTSLSSGSVELKEQTVVQSSVKPAGVGGIPNFLFDGAKVSQTSFHTENASESSGDKNTVSRDCDNGQELKAEALPKKMSAKPKDNKKPKRGPPPSSNSPSGGKVKSMTIMTSPGKHTLVSLNVPSTPSASVKTPPANVKTPPANVKTPSASVKTPSASVKTPPANVKTPPANVKTPSANVKTPSASVKTPPANVKTPSASVKTPPANVKTPPANVKTPPANVKTPPANVKTPSSSVEAKDNLETAVSMCSVSVSEASAEKDPDLSVDKRPSPSRVPDAPKQELVSSNSVETAKSSVKKTSRAKRKVLASPDEEEKATKRKMPLPAETEVKNAKRKKLDFTKEDKKGSKAKKPASTPKVNVNEKGGKEVLALGSTEKVCDRNKASDKKAVVLNVPVVKTRGGRRTAANTKPSTGKQTGGVKGKKNSSPANEHSRKRSSAALSKATKESPAASDATEGSSTTQNTNVKPKRKRTTTAATGKGSTKPPSNAKTKTKRVSAPVDSPGKKSTPPKQNTKGRRKRTSAATKGGASEEDLPLRAVAAKIKDQ